MLAKANTSLQNAIERIQAHSTQETLMLERVQLHVSICVFVCLSGLHAQVCTCMYMYYIHTQCNTASYGICRSDATLSSVRTCIFWRKSSRIRAHRRLKASSSMPRYWNTCILIAACMQYLSCIHRLTHTCTYIYTQTCSELSDKVLHLSAEVEARNARNRELQEVSATCKFPACAKKTSTHADGFFGVTICVYIYTPWCHPSCAALMLDAQYVWHSRPRKILKFACLTQNQTQHNTGLACSASQAARGRITTRPAAAGSKETWAGGGVHCVTSSRTAVAVAHNRKCNSSRALDALPAAVFSTASGHGVGAHSTPTW
jgi:hypothetical protein